MFLFKLFRKSSRDGVKTPTIQVEPASAETPGAANNSIATIADSTAPKESQETNALNNPVSSILSDKRQLFNDAR